MKISFYEGNIKNTRKSQIITIGEFLNYVKYCKYESLSQKIAAIEDKEKRQAEKSKVLPYVTLSGVFSERNSNSILEHSGYICIDVDEVDVSEFKKTLSEDPYTFAVFLSVSKKGLAVIVKTSNNVENHLSHFLWLEQYYYDTYGIVIDTSCKDVSRARFVSSDPEIFINEKSKPAGKKVLKKLQPKTINWVATETQLDRIVSEIVSKGLNIAESYQDYLTIAFALANGYGENARQHFHAICGLSSKYNTQQADKKYSNAIKTGSKISVGSFFYLAKQAGVELRTREEEKAFSVAKAAKKSNSNVLSAVETAQNLGISKELAQEVANAVFKSNDNLDDKEIPIIEEIAAFLQINSNLKRNKITRFIQDGDRQIDNIVLNTLYIKSKTVLGNKVTKADVESIIFSDFTPEFCPFQAFAEKYKDYPISNDIDERIIDTLKLKDERAKIFVFNWLFSIPATIHGETVRYVLTLIGGQETGKTEWFRRLLPDELKVYFAESNLMRDKDDEVLMCQSLIILDDEMGGKSKKDSQKFKELTSKEWFTLREPYGKGHVRLKRLGLLCGTTNDHQVIYDATGNTRILPVEITGAYDFEAYNKIDKIELFMYLWKYYKKGCWQLQKDAKEFLAEISKNYQPVNSEAELIDKYFENPTSSLSSHFLTSTEIKMYIEQQSEQRIQSINKFGIELRNRFERVAKKVNGATKYGYKVQYIK